MIEDGEGKWEGAGFQIKEWCNLYRTFLLSVYCDHTLLGRKGAEAG